MHQSELQPQVLGILERFNGIEPLKELVWSKLNYERVHKPITRRSWPEPVASALNEDPTLLGAGTTSIIFVTG